MATKKGTNALKDVDVDRVDGVESPATSKPFLIFKSGDEAEVRENAQNLAELVVAALQALKSGDALVSEEAAVKLNELATTLNVDVTFQAAAPPEKTDETDGDDDETPSEDGDSGEETPAEEGDDGGDEAPSAPQGELAQVLALAKSQQATIAQLIELQKGRVQPGAGTPPRATVKKTSNQVRAQDSQIPVKKSMGQGLFENIVFPA